MHGVVLQAAAHPVDAARDQSPEAVPALGLPTPGRGCGSDGLSLALVACPLPHSPRRSGGGTDVSCYESGIPSDVYSLVCLVYGVPLPLQHSWAVGEFARVLKDGTVLLSADNENTKHPKRRDR